MAAINITSVNTFNGGVNAFITFGVLSEELLSTTARTWICIWKATAAGGNNTPYLFGRTDNSGNGMRQFVAWSGSADLRCGYSSTGNAIRPNTQANSEFTNNNTRWNITAQSHDGTTTLASAIKIFHDLTTQGILAEATYTSPVDGSGTINDDAAREFQIGNRGTARDRGFAGKIAALIGIDRRITDATELNAVLAAGVLNDPDHCFVWANGRDYGPYALAPTTIGAGVSTITTDLPPFVYLGDDATGLNSDVKLEPMLLQASGSVAINGSLSAQLENALLISDSDSPLTLTLTSQLENSILSAYFASEASVSLNLDVELEPALLSFTASTANSISSDVQLTQTHLEAQFAVATQCEAAQTLNDAVLSASFTNAIDIHSDHDRSSVDLAGSSVSGTGDSAIISIKPKVQESEVVSGETRWLKPHARVTGVNNIKPKFRFTEYKSGVGGSHNYPWPATRRPMYCYSSDEEQWFYFDNCTLNSGSQYVEFWNNADFTENEIYVSWNRAVRPKRFGQWIEDWQLANPLRVFPTQPAIDHAPTPAVADWPAQIFIADEFSPQTDSLGGTIPACPLYSFAIRDDSVSSPLGSKAIIHFQMMTHASEDMGLYIIREMIEYLLAGTGDAPALLQYFDFTFSFNNVPGWAGGGWRGSYTQGIGGADDSNRHANESGTTLEIVDLPKAVMQSLFAGRVVSMFIDMHGAFSAPLWIYNTSGTDDTEFVDAVNSFGLPTVVNGGITEGTGFWSTWANTYTPDSFTYEVGDPTPVPYSDITSAGVNLARAINKLRADGNLIMPVLTGAALNVLLENARLESSSTVATQLTSQTQLEPTLLQSNATTANSIYCAAILSDALLTASGGQPAVGMSVDVQLTNALLSSTVKCDLTANLSANLTDAQLSSDSTVANSMNLSLLLGSAQLESSSRVANSFSFDAYLREITLYAILGESAVLIPKHRTIFVPKKNRTIYS